jgi:hypothetical protein
LEEINMMDAKDRDIFANSVNTKEVNVEQKTAQVEEEPLSAFAMGLPDWSIEPPQVFVRRK